MLRQNARMLLYIAMADAYAAAFEYLKPEESNLVEQGLLIEGYQQHPRHELRAGQYTDDAEMSIANTNAILAGLTTDETIVQAYLDEFEFGGRRKGYAGAGRDDGFQSLLEKSACAIDFLANIHNGSTRNGAAMRAVPFGVIPSVLNLIHMAEHQARLTHFSREGMLSAKLIALMSHYALYEKGSLADVGSWCSQYLKADERCFEFALTEPWPQGHRLAIKGVPQTIAMQTVHAVAHVLRTQSSLLDIMRWVLTMGGDTDSVAAIAWGIASAHYPDTLPEFFERDLEGGSEKTGAKRLLALGTKLMQKYS